MADHNAVGNASATFRMDVERGKIREFARATGSTNPAYLEAEQPVVPPTFLATQAFWQDQDAELWHLAAMDTSRGLHAEQEYEFFGPPPQAGARLTFQTTVVDLYTKESRRGGVMTFGVAVTKFFDDSGRLVAEARFTGVEIPVPPADRS
jgi:N-terminal half of MaoC dehydratase